MKTKELRNIAKKIAQAELKYQQATDTQTKKEIEQEIMSLTSKADSFEDLITLDEMVQDILSMKTTSG